MSFKAPLIITAAGFILAGSLAASTRDEAAPVHMVVTVVDPRIAPALRPGDLSIVAGGVPAPVIGLHRLAGDMANMQLFVLLDDSSRSSSLSIHFPELKSFLESLPATTQVAVGYMRNGMQRPIPGFSADHRQVADSLRLPLAIPGVNGSPYFALSELMEHWPAAQPVPRRAVLMFTDGVDRYYGGPAVQDPYVDDAIRSAAKQGVAVYSIYLHDAGDSGSLGAVNLAQSRLQQVAEQTGGYAYFEGLSNPVTIAPFLRNLRERFDNQYEVTAASVHGKGLQPVKLHSTLRDVKITAATRIFLP